jgi:hypothetical protein
MTVECQQQSPANHWATAIIVIRRGPEAGPRHPPGLQPDSAHTNPFRALLLQEAPVPSRESRAHGTAQALRGALNLQADRGEHLSWPVSPATTTVDLRPGLKGSHSAAHSITTPGDLQIS